MCEDVDASRASDGSTASYVIIPLPRCLTKFLFNYARCPIFYFIGRAAKPFRFPVTIVAHIHCPMYREKHRTGGRIYLQVALGTKGCEQLDATIRAVFPPPVNAEDGHFDRWFRRFCGFTRVRKEYEYYPDNQRHGGEDEDHQEPIGDARGFSEPPKERSECGENRLPSAGERERYETDNDRAYDRGDNTVSDRM